MCMKKPSSYLPDLKKSGVKAVLFSDVTPEPDPEIADLGTEIALKEKARCVIGIGGGSTMDVAKAIAVLVKNYKIAYGH